MTNSPLTIVNRQQDPLDAEDFRRLGVRPNEYRLGVIRGAAARSARPLADQQLNRPNERTIRQLSKVVASAYRLMDPRRRPSSTQRARVGRILPLTLGVAGRTKFSLEDPDVDDQQLLSDRQQTALVTEIDLFDGSGGSRNPSKSFAGDFLGVNRPTASEDEIWQTALQDEDLVAMTPAARKLRHVQRRFKKRWFAIIGTGLMIGAILGFLTIQRSVSPETIAAASVASKTQSEAVRDVTQRPFDLTRDRERIASPTETLPAPKADTVAGHENGFQENLHRPDPFATGTRSESLNEMNVVDDVEKKGKEQEINTTRMDEIPVDSTERGLRGRMRMSVDADVTNDPPGSPTALDDAGVSIRYEPGVPITAGMLAAFEKHLRRPLAGVTISLRGAFEHHESDQLSVQLLGDQAGIHQQVMIDGEPIDTLVLARSAGTHQLEWRLSFMQDFSLDKFDDEMGLTIARVSRSDPANWQPVSVFSLKLDRDREEPSDLKVAIIPSGD